MDIFIWTSFSFLVYLFSINDVSALCTANRCGECIAQFVDEFDTCFWCFQPNFNHSRCATEQELKNLNCKNMTSGSDSTIEYIQNMDLSNGNETDGTQPVQLKPQHIKLRLKPNQLFKWNIAYRVAENFPVDLYFLSDPSYTMRHFKEQLVRLASTIAKSIEVLTKNYRFGFGTAMDKVTLPFSHTAYRRLQDPCINSECSKDPSRCVVCEPPYSYKHRMSLTRDIQLFMKEVNDTQLTGNYDSPEGGFDGLLQSLVCEGIIGWRNKSTRLLVYSTDTDYHFSGDGRLAGIVKPNDGLCHMDPLKNEYTMSLQQDYPSVGQIVEKVKEHKMNVIFAITKSFLNDYVKLSEMSAGMTAAELDPNATNIVDIITEKYREIRQKISFVLPDYDPLQIKMITNCGGRVKDEKIECKNVTIGREIIFEVHTTLAIEKCPDNPEDRKTTLKLYPEGVGEQVIIDIEYICECDCQKPGDQIGQAEISSPKCNEKGTYECGICKCDQGWSGDLCDCDNRLTELEACSSPEDNSTDSLICTGQGSCTCNKCVCSSSRYTGEYCECDNEGCPSYGGQLCAGNGVCSCGVCNCTAGFNGSDCHCPISNQNCLTGNGTECSGNGKCECGICVCDPDYSGIHCQLCPKCTQTCEVNTPCVMCKGFNEYSDAMAEQKCRQTCQHVSIADPLPDENVNISLCSIVDSNGCVIRFTHQIVESSPVILVQNRRFCPPPPPNVLVLGLSIAGGVFLVALILLLLWRLFAYFFDSIEYAKFEEEIKNPRFGFDENPIYKGCVSKYNNPMHDANAAEKKAF